MGLLLIGDIRCGMFEVVRSTSTARTGIIALPIGSSVTAMRGGDMVSGCRTARAPRAPVGLGDCNRRMSEALANVVSPYSKRGDA